jgi:hypothetical protein
MSNSFNELAQSIKIKFGTSPNEPTDLQLSNVIKDIDAIFQSGKRPTESEWFNIVKKYCPTAGTWKYAGLDNSDLNTLLIMARK